MTGSSVTVLVPVTDVIVAMLTLTVGYTLLLVTDNALTYSVVVETLVLAYVLARLAGDKDSEVGTVG